MTDYKNITWKYLSILFILFGLLVSGRLYYDYHHHKWMLEQKTQSLANNIKKSFETAEENLINKYMMLGLHLMQSKNMTALFEERKREEMYSRLKMDFHEFKHLDPNLHVMHFIDKDNLTVLRMHKPLSYDDNLTVKRPLVAYVNKSLKQQNAFEVGKNGIVYRVTMPFFKDTKHIGVLEFGIKPSYFVDVINKQYDVESEILVKNELLDVLLIKKEYKKVGDYSIVSQSKLLKKLSPMIDLKKNRQVIDCDGRSYIVITNLDLSNYLGEDVAKVVIAEDITSYVENNKDSMFFVNTMTITILIFTFIFLYLIFTKYVNEIRNNIIKMTELHKKSVYFERRANRDSLTQAYNKEYLNHHLDDFLKVGGNGVILFFDIDHFKKCNDTHGHLLGDEVLIKISQTIQDYLRSNDLFVRWGGEEFIILFEDITDGIAIKRAEEIRKLIENTKFSNNIPITISIGVTRVRKDDTINSLLKRADGLLYKAKESGRNKVVTDNS